MILNRIRPHLDPLLRPHQNGFRENRSTTSHILALRRLIEGIKDKNLTCIITFIDFKKAFDSVHRGKMLKILRAYGIPEIIVEAISIMYDNTQAIVLSPDGKTEMFDILAGVLQGDTLAPFLFIVVLDYVMRKAIGDDNDQLGFTVRPRRSRRYPVEVLTDLDFADDIALLSDTLDQAQELLSRVETVAATVGLHMNSSKTKFMQYNLSDQQSGIKTSEGQYLERVEDFQYLGSWIATSNRDFNVRKAKAWDACNKMKNIWKSNLPRQLKSDLFKATVESILLYGAECWTLSKNLEQRLDGCYTRMLRTAFNISWREHLTLEEIYGNLPRISQVLRERRLRFAGHCFRRIDEPVAKLVLWTPTQGRRNCGRPQLDYINQICNDTGFKADELGKAMADRVQWQSFVRQVFDRGRP